MKPRSPQPAVEIRDVNPDCADVYFKGNRFGSVERHWSVDKCDYEWMVFTNVFDSNRPVLDKAEGITYLEALIAMGTS